MADGVEEREVSPLELFYDLVFVFAISQLSTHLAHELTWRGAAETLVLLCAVFTVWIQTTFEATYFDITVRQTQIGLLVAMALGLFMNAAIGVAFDELGWAFAVALVVTQITRGTITSIKAPTAPLRQHYRRALTWMLASTPLWLIGAAIPPAPRLWVWGAATAIDVTGIWLAHPWPHSRMVSSEIAFDETHMTERLRLFLIIALGEAILTTGTAIAQAPTDVATVFAGAAGFALVAALWALYFAGSSRIVEPRTTPVPDPIWAARMGANAHYMVLAGLVATAVGCETVIGESLAGGALPVGFLLGGGALLYVATQSWFLYVTTHQPLIRRWVGCALLAAVIPAAAILPALATLLIVTATVIALAMLAPRRRYAT
jgi:low temperature requirement protein LtrA